MTDRADSPNLEPLKQGDSRSHLPGLDGLRAFAILAVMVSHANRDLPLAWQGVAGSGWYGVILFFVLSGFLITKGLLAARGAGNFFRSFYAKRFLRIFPLYYLALAVCTLLLPRLLDVPRPTRHDIWLYWLYLSNWSRWMDLPLSPMLGHFWSLAVEEQFYLLWPAFVFLLDRKHLAWFSFSWLLASPALRAVLLIQQVDGEAIYRNTFCRMDALMAGALCAIILTSSRWQHRIHRHQAAILAAGLLGPATAILFVSRSYYTWQMLTFGLSIFTLSFACLVLCYGRKEINPGLLHWRPLRYIAVWSYGIYVYHLPLIYLAHRYRWGTGLNRIAIEFTITIALAALSYRFFEYPILQLKHRFVPEFRAGAVQPRAVTYASEA